MNRYERQVELLLRCYPSAWRQERGEEMYATLMDLADDGRRSVPMRVALDLLVGGWRERARRHTRLAGALGAGWQLTVGIAVVGQLVVSVVWLRDFALTGTPAVLVHMIGNASAITYGLALVSFIIGAIAWLAHQRQLARVAGLVAITSWVLTVAVFPALSHTMWSDWLQVVSWSYLAAVATVGMFQPPPTHPRLAGATALVAVLISQLLTSGVTPTSDHNIVYLAEQTLRLGLLDRGTDTLHTALRSGWTLLAIAGLALARIDPRPLLAAGWLLPLIALDHLAWGGPIVPATGAAAGLAVVAAAIASTRSTRPNAGPNPSL